MERIPHAPPLPCHPERSGERDVSRGVERVLHASVPVTNFFAVFGTAHRSLQDPSARSLISFAPSIGMTWGFFDTVLNFTFYILHFTFLRGRLGADITSRASRMRRAAEEERRHSPKRQAPRLGADITSRASRKARGGRGAQAFPEAAGSARGRRHARQNAPSLLSQIYKTP